MANFSLDDALAGNVTQQDLQDYGAALGNWDYGGSPLQWQDKWTDPQKMKLLSQSGNATGGLWQNQGGGQVSVPDKYLWNNMPDAGGFGGFDWGELAGPGALLAGPFAGMMGAFGGAGLGAEASALTGSGGFGSGFGSIGETGGAGALTGGGMDLGDWQDWSGLTNNTGLDFNTTNFPDLNPDTANAYDTALRGAGIDPSSPNVLDQLKSLATSNPASLAKILGTLGGAGLSYLGGQKQASSLNSLAQQNLAYGAPSRARFEASMTPGFDPMSIPGYSGALDTASKGILARLSATGGNPYGNPGGLIDANKQIINGTALPAIQNYQNENLNAGFGPGFGASNTAATGAINANAGSLTGAAGALGQLTAPDNSLASLIAQLNSLKLGNGTTL